MGGSSSKELVMPVDGTDAAEAAAAAAAAAAAQAKAEQVKTNAAIAYFDA